MNWILQSDQNDFDELSNKPELTYQEEYRLEELSQNIDYYNKTYGGNN